MIGMITTVFGIGRMRPGPGTWASAFAVLLAIPVYQAGGALLIPLGGVLAALIGFWTVPQALRMTTDEDPSEIVIDEVAGQWLAMSFTVIPLWRHGVSILDAWPGFVVPFLLFRLFDIWKPWLVGRADRQGGAIGVMMDDLWAGLFAGIGSVALAGLYHALLEPML